MSGLPLQNGKIHIACPACGKTNAIPVERAHEGPVCGSCKAAVPIDRPVDLNDSTFGQLVEHAQAPVLVDFWGSRCGPCRMMAPILERLAKGHAGKLLVGKLSTEENMGIPAFFQIRAIPTLILFKNGKEVARQVGLVPEQVLEKLLLS